jgi:hypothetical protein
MADGGDKWIESAGSTTPTPEGHYVINSRDVSEWKSRERASVDISPERVNVLQITYIKL